MRWVLPLHVGTTWGHRTDAVLVCSSWVGLSSPLPLSSSSPLLPWWYVHSFDSVVPKTTLLSASPKKSCDATHRQRPRNRLRRRRSWRRPMHSRNRGAMRVEPQQEDSERTRRLVFTVAVGLALLVVGIASLLFGDAVLALSCWAGPDCLTLRDRESAIGIAFLLFGGILVIAAVVLAVRGFRKWRRDRMTSADV